MRVGDHVKSKIWAAVLYTDAKTQKKKNKKSFQKEEFWGEKVSGEFTRISPGNIRRVKLSSAVNWCKIETARETTHTHIHKCVCMQMYVYKILCVHRRHAVRERLLRDHRVKSGSQMEKTCRGAESKRRATRCSGWYSGDAATCFEYALYSWICLYAPRAFRGCPVQKK